MFSFWVSFFLGRPLLFLGTSVSSVLWMAVGDDTTLASTFLCDGEAENSTAGLMIGPISGLMAGVLMTGAVELSLDTVAAGEDIMAVAEVT